VRDNNQAIPHPGWSVPVVGRWVSGSASRTIRRSSARWTTPEQLAKDLSAYEGISFWARRGPDSQVGFRVLVGDKYTGRRRRVLMYATIDAEALLRARARVRLPETTDPAWRSTSIARTVAARHTNPGPQGVCRPCPAPARRPATLSSVARPVMNGTVSTDPGRLVVQHPAPRRVHERWRRRSRTTSGSGGACRHRPRVLEQAVLAVHAAQRNLRYWCFDPAAGERPAETPSSAATTGRAS
jgi:hypothetical protein